MCGRVADGLVGGRVVGLVGVVRCAIVAQAVNLVPCVPVRRQTEAAVSFQSFFSFSQVVYVVFGSMWMG